MESNTNIDVEGSFSIPHCFAVVVAMANFGNYRILHKPFFYAAS